MENGMVEAKLVVGCMFIAFLGGVCLTLILTNWLDKRAQKRSTNGT